MMLTARQVAEMLNVNTARVYQLAREGVLPSVRLLRQVRFSEDAIREFIARGGQALPGGWRKEA